jgi:hypothetical protein
MLIQLYQFNLMVLVQLIVTSNEIQAELVSEGAKHLFSLCEKRHFSPVRNHILLLRTV